MPHRKSPKAALPYLPLEVKEIIIDQLSDNTNALRSCTLTRRSWVTRSQFHLLQAIRIKTRAQLDVLYRHLDANPARRALVRSVTVAPDSPKERAYLLGIFPHALLTGLPNLRTWVIQDVDGGDDHQKTRPGQPNLSFHKTTLTQLRYTTIEELHLSHILFGSDGELIRLIGSLPHLRHLQYAHLHFRRHRGLVSPGSFTRILHSLSTLDIHVQDTEDQTADALIKMAQRTLRSLTLRLHPRARWGSSPCSTSRRNPVCLKLDSLTLHVEPDGDLPPNSLPDFVLEICQYATDRISTFHRASTVKELAIHVTSSASLPSASLALRLINSDYFLDRFRSLHLDLVGQVPSRFQLCVHLPPRTQPRGVVVQGTVLASDNFVFEESYQQQVQYYSEGNVWRTATKSEGDSVVALAISPDRKWIASGSRQHAILWNAMAGGGSNQQYVEMVHEWIAPVDDDPFTQPLAFSPDSLVLVCCTRDPEAFIQARDVITGELLAVLRAPGEAVNGFDTCRASCVWSRNGETLTSVVFIPSQHKFVVQVWNAENYRMISTTTEITSFHSPSFLYSPNGHWLASCQTARGHYQTSPPVSFMRNVGARTMLGAPLTSIPMDCHILSATFDQSSTRFAAVSSDQVLHVWSLSTGTKLLQVPMNEYPNDSERLVLTFSPDGTQLLSCSGGRGASFVLTIRDAASGRTLLPRRPGYHFLRTRTAPRFVFSDDGRHLLSASEDGFVQLWLAADASFFRDIARGGDAPTRFAWSEGGKVLAWGTESGGVVVKPL